MRSAVLFDTLRTLLPFLVATGLGKPWPWIR